MQAFAINFTRIALKNSGNLYVRRAFIEYAYIKLNNIHEDKILSLTWF